MPMHADGVVDVAAGDEGRRDGTSGCIFRRRGPGAVVCGRLPHGVVPSVVPQAAVAVHALKYTGVRLTCTEEY